MTLLKKLLSAALMLGIIACNGVENQKSPAPKNQIAEIDKVRLADLSGQPIDLRKYAGKTIFINFWATWCQPCIAEMPFINNAQEILKNEPVLFFLASAETEDEIKTFQNANNFNFQYVMIKNLEELNIQALPTTLIFNPKGELAYSQQGVRKWNDKQHIGLILKIISN